MNAQSLILQRNIAAWLLILCGVVFAVGSILYTGRAMLKWSAAESSAYLIWERGFIIAAALIYLSSLALLEGVLSAAGNIVFARIGLIITLIAVAVIVIAEASFISNVDMSSRGQAYAQIVIYVVLAFLGQAAIGVALLQTEVVAGWVGWATIIWNLVWLIILPLVSPRDIYYPVLHYAAPVLIGITLLLKR